MSIDLASISTRAPRSFEKEKTKARLESILIELEELQNLLYASKKAAVLVVLQGMDASGKDGLTRDVFGRLNPQGVQVTSFKVPSEEERAHDFLWRIHKATPARGMIAVFNRSQYEEVLVNSVLHGMDEATVQQRLDAINDFERLLVSEGTAILKCYLHVSEERQLERVRERTVNPRKMWKYNAEDLKDIGRREQYLAVYSRIFGQCSEQPWTIVPADQNWFKNYTAAVALRDLLKELRMEYPRIK